MPFPIKPFIINTHNFNHNTDLGCQVGVLCLSVDYILVYAYYIKQHNLHEEPA